MKRLALAVCCAVACCCAALAGTISIQPATTDVALGSPVALNVNVLGIADLYGFQFDVIFNPAVLSAVSVTEGSLFSSIGVFFSPGTIDNTAGTITFIGDSLSGPGPGINTDGTLAQMLFTAIGPGSSSVDISNIVLLDSTLSDITANAVSGSVSVTGVPEPSCLPVLGASLLLLITRLRRSSR